MSVGSSPFTRAALRVENGAETQYYILPEDSAVLNKTDFLTLRGDLVIKPLYFINNVLASIEYYLTDIEETAGN